jgi:hypothetical protein
MANRTPQSRFSQSPNRTMPHSVNRMAQLANHRIVNESAIVSRQSSMDADTLEPD